jgi:hypothetical protein
MRALAVCLIAVAPAAYGQDPSKTQQAKPAQISEAEEKALIKVRDAADPAAKLAAADEFVKKYPNSTKRNEVVVHIIAEIVKVTDPAQQITMLEIASKVFTQPADTEKLNPVLIDAYLKAERLDDAFRIAAAMVEKNPNDVTVIAHMALVGTNQARRNNPKFLQQSQQYSLKAIELIEADKKPATLDAAQWADYKTRMLGDLYQAAGILAYVSGNKPEAKPKLEKAASLNVTDPVTYMLLADLVDTEYRQLAEQHKTMATGAPKDELLKKALAKMDEAINMIARVVAMTEGKPQMQQVHDKFMQDLESYYKFRHNGSTEGMRQLIDKHKTPSPSQ